MKFEIHMKDKSVAQSNEAMYILDSYFTMNPRISDIRLLMGDSFAIDKF